MPPSPAYSSYRPHSKHQLFWACQIPNSQTVTQVPQRQGGGDTPLDNALPKHLLGVGGVVVTRVQFLG